MHREVLNIQEVGEIFLFRKSGSKISLCIRPFEGMQLTVPREMSTAEVLRFLEDRKGWIDRARKKVARIESARTEFTPHTNFSTRFHRLEWQEGTHPARFVFHINPGTFRVEYPREVDFSSPGVQTILRKGIEEVLRKEALQDLPERLDRLSAKTGLVYHGLSVKNLKSRWGSCSMVNHINLNLHLMRLPDALVDYVVLHELAHTRQKNHGPDFWKLLDRLTGGQAREQDRALKQYHTRYY